MNWHKLRIYDTHDLARMWLWADRCPWAIVAYGNPDACNFSARLFY